jgi:FixJ family two-component response regulator
VKPLPPRTSTGVVIVETDEALRDSLAFALRVEGYAVRAFSLSTEFMKDQDAPQHCLVIDAAAKHFEAALACFRARAPKGAVVVVAGARESRTWPEPAVTLAKPLSGGAILRAVEEALRRARARNVSADA